MVNPKTQEIKSYRPSDSRASNTQNVEGAICVRHISVSGALQFAVLHAVCCVLHRPASQVIHCSELFDRHYHHYRSSPHQILRNTSQWMGPRKQTTIPWRSRGTDNTNETLLTTKSDIHVSDPSAGSPTETLLRLLLPLDDTV